MNIKWVGAHSNNYTVGRSKPIKIVALHWIVGTLESADATFNNPDRKASAHYGIGDDDVHQWVRESDTAWHAGNWEANQISIGIEHEGGWLLPDGTRQKPSDKTHETSAKLVADICARNDIPIDKEHIRTHREYSATTCPGTLDVDRIIELAKSYSAPDTGEVITDPQAKLALGDPWGVQELQATQSILNDQARDLENCQNNCDDRVNQAVEQAISERDDYWQKELESANQELEECKQSKCEDLSWQDHFKLAWQKFFEGR
jgi:hypothetical protein